MTLMLHLNDVPLEASRDDACVAPATLTTTALWRKNHMPCPCCHVTHNPLATRRRYMWQRFSKRITS